MPKQKKRLIKQFPENPRIISDLALEQLGASLAELGSLDGFVVNRSPGKYEDCIVSGNQKDKIINLNEAKVILVKTYDPPTASGTIAVGQVEHNGELFPYREVYWNEEQCEVANIRANNSGGINDAAKLALFSQNVLKLSGIDLGVERQLQQIRINYNFKGLGTPVNTGVHGAPEETEEYEPDIVPHRVEEAFNRFLANAVRQVVLFFEGDAYERFLNNIEGVKQALNLEDNTEAVEAMLAFYMEQNGIEPAQALKATEPATEKAE